MIKGILDRIEDGRAVILVEELNEQFTILDSKLPPNSKEGTWFSLKQKDGKFEILGIDQQLTEKKVATSADLLAQLQAKSKGSKYKRS